MHLVVLGNTLSARHDLCLKIPLVCLFLGRVLNPRLPLSVPSTVLLPFGQNDLIRIMLGIWRTQPIEPVPSLVTIAIKK